MRSDEHYQQELERRERDPDIERAERIAELWARAKRADAELKKLLGERNGKPF